MECTKFKRPLKRFFLLRWILIASVMPSLVHSISPFLDHIDPIQLEPKRNSSTVSTWQLPLDKGAGSSSTNHAYYHVLLYIMGIANDPNQFSDKHKKNFTEMIEKRTDYFCYGNQSGRLGRTAVVILEVYPKYYHTYDKFLAVKFKVDYGGECLNQTALMYIDVEIRSIPAHTIKNFILPRNTLHQAASEFAPASTKMLYELETSSSDWIILSSALIVGSFLFYGALHVMLYQFSKLNTTNSLAGFEPADEAAAKPESASPPSQPVRRRQRQQSNNHGVSNKFQELNGTGPIVAGQDSSYERANPTKRMENEPTASSTETTLQHNTQQNEEITSDLEDRGGDVPSKTGRSKTECAVVYGAGDQLPPNIVIHEAEVIGDESDALGTDSAQPIPIHADEAMSGSVIDLNSIKLAKKQLKKAKLSSVTFEHNTDTKF